MGYDEAVDVDVAQGGKGHEHDERGVLGEERYEEVDEEGDSEEVGEPFSPHKIDEEDA